MPFLLKSDYAALIKQDLLNAVLDSQDFIRTDAELSAQCEIEGYLRGRYDLHKVFFDVLPYAAAQQYAAGAVVHHGTAPAPALTPLIYVATRASIGEMPGAAAAAPEPDAEAPADAEDPAPAAEPVLPAWELRDPRHPLLKTYLIDCTLYLIHSRQNPRTVPQIRQDRYDHVIAWLNLCRQGKISPGLPVLSDKQADGTPNRESIRPRGGSLPKLRNAY